LITMHLLVTSSSLPVLDETSLAELRDLGPEAFDEVVLLFATDVPQRLARLHQAVTMGEADAVRREAHGLKGGALAVGAVKMAHLCAALEHGGVCIDLGVETDVASAFDDARAALAEQRKGLGVS
jgi:HPt (histidine-containing phosphotransfer) domain-containing protein